MGTRCAGRLGCGWRLHQSALCQRSSSPGNVPPVGISDRDSFYLAALDDDLGPAVGEPKWITFAVAQGLVQRSVIQTSSGEERSFLFTPHLNRGPFGATAGDASGQVRQLVGSMIYAATYAEYKLYNPAAFISALIRNVEAGDASPIGTDYPMLETAGIVRVVPGSSDDRYRLELLQSEIAEDALQILSERNDSRGNPNDLAAFRAQQRYVHIDRERARLALEARTDDVEQECLISALRDETTRGAFRKPMRS